MDGMVEWEFKGVSSEYRGTMVSFGWDMLRIK